MSEQCETNGLGSLGFYFLAVLYFSQMIASILSSAVAQKMGLKFTFMLGGFCMSVMIICQAMPALKTQRELQNIEDTGSFMDKLTSRNGVLSVLLIGSLFGGVSQAMMGVASCDFIARSSTEKTKGFYYGYLFAWYMASNIPGNYIGSILIK